MSTEPVPPNNPLIEMLRARIGTPLDDIPSPLGVWLGGTLRAVADDGLEVAFTVREEMTNPAQVLHGGIVAAIADEMLGMSVIVFSGGRYHASVNLNVDYLAPARAGDTIVARSRIVRLGSRLVNAECTLHAANGHMLARATSNLIVVDE